MRIHQLFTDNQLRNFSYIIEISDKIAFVIDPWDKNQINALLNQHALKLKAIINTHEHWDHTQGNEDLVAEYGCEVWAHAVGKGKIPCQTHFLHGNDCIELDDETRLEVIDAPGHCQAHLCFVLHHKKQVECIFTGDILFNAGVGNCHNGGDVHALYETVVHKIATLNPSVQIYPGHEYLENNLKFTLKNEPNNKIAQNWLHKCQQNSNSTLVSTLADEKQINTFLRLDNKELRKNLNCVNRSDKEVFIKLRALRDKW